MSDTHDPQTDPGPDEATSEANPDAGAEQERPGSRRSHCHDNGNGRREERERVRESRREERRDDRQDRGRGRRDHRGRRRSGHRKERILHTRISEQLSEDIRAMADELRLPVSNLVRNVLEEAFSVVEQVSDDLGGVFEEVMEGAEEASDRYRSRGRRRHRRHDYKRDFYRGWQAPADDADFRDSEPSEEAEAADPEPPSNDLFAGIVAWQPVVLHAPQHCAKTGRRMEAGERAHAAIGPHGLTGLYVREDALPVD